MFLFTCVDYGCCLFVYVLCWLLVVGLTYVYIAVGLWLVELFLFSMTVSDL